VVDIVINIFSYSEAGCTLEFAKTEINEPIVLLLEHEEFKGKVKGDFTGELSSGKITIEILDENDDIIWQDDVVEISNFKKEFEIKEFNNNMKVVIIKDDDTIGKFEYYMKGN
jgi:hypothetical protein